ncbi:MAG: DoxX family protein [Solirubrobacteraceae bacterium]
MHPGRRNAIAASATQIAGGASLAAGLATPVAASSLTATMLTAIHRVHQERLMDRERWLRIQPPANRRADRSRGYRSRRALPGRTPRTGQERHTMGPRDSRSRRNWRRWRTCSGWVTVSTLQHSRKRHVDAARSEPTGA